MKKPLKMAFFQVFLMIFLLNKKSYFYFAPKYNKMHICKFYVKTTFSEQCVYCTNQIAD